jgi:hypothetical protein
MEIEGRELGRGDYVANRDVLRRACKGVTAASAARALNEPGAAQPQQDLLDVIDRKTLARRDVAARDGAL